MAMTPMNLKRLRTILFTMAIATAGLVPIACEEEATEDEAKKERTAPDPKRTIKVEKRFPADEAFKDAIYKIEWRTDEGYDFTPEKVQALIAAAQVNLLPSSAMRSCRYSDNEPVYKISLPLEDGTIITMQSSSRCEGLAPWNVVKDGKLWIQLGGEIGTALLPVLSELDTPRFEHIKMPNPARIQLSTAVGAVEEGVESQPDSWSKFPDWLAASDEFKALVGEEAEVKETRVVCSQTTSKQCTELIGSALVDWKGKVLDLNATLTRDSLVGLDLPEDPKEFDAFLESKLFKAVEKSAAGNPITVSYDKRGDCKLMTPGIENFKPDVADPDSLSCAYYSAIVEAYTGGTVYPPYVRYFPALGAAKLENHADRTDEAFYKGLGGRDTIMEAVLLDRVRFYMTLDGTLAELEK